MDKPWIYEEIKKLIDSEIKLIEVVTHDMERVYYPFTISKEQYNLYRWNEYSSYKYDDGNSEDDHGKWMDKSKDSDVIKFIKDAQNSVNQHSTLIFIENLSCAVNLKSGNINRIEAFLKEFALHDKEDNVFLIFINIIPFKSQMIEKEIYTIYLPLPNYEVLEEIYKNNDGTELEPDIKEQVINSALGLTHIEAERAFKLSKTYTNIDEKINTIVYEKENIIKKSGYVEYLHNTGSMADIGGLDSLKEWIEKRQKGFSENAKNLGLKNPKGIILVGIPGTGKSISAKAVGASMKVPVLRFDVGKVFSSLIGSSEENMRKTLELAEAISPCVLWIDEIEKGFSGIESSGRTDGGTTARVFGSFLTWMQEKTKPVFVVATSNGVHKLPPEFLRKGRFDEIFYIGLPNKDDRKAIIKIHLDKIKEHMLNDHIDKLASETRFYTGADIEQLLQEALYEAFDKDEILSYEHIQEVKKSFDNAVEKRKEAYGNIAELCIDYKPASKNFEEYKK